MDNDIELDREVDGRWIAEVPSVPGAMAYGATAEEAIREARALASEAIADAVWARRVVRGTPKPIKPRSEKP